MICLGRKRRIYDLLSGSLSAEEAQRLQKHLETCPRCSREYQAMQKLFNLVSQKRPPEPSQEFWANFERELEEKLAAEKLLPQEIEIRPHYLPRISPKPAFALATVFVLLLSLSFYLFGGLPTPANLTYWADERLANEVVLLEDLTGESIAPTEAEFIFEELEMLEELG